MDASFTNSFSQAFNCWSCYSLMPEAWNCIWFSDMDVWDSSICTSICYFPSISAGSWILSGVAGSLIDPPLLDVNLLTSPLIGCVTMPSSSKSAFLIMMLHCVYAWILRVEGPGEGCGTSGNNYAIREGKSECQREKTACNTSET